MPPKLTVWILGDQLLDKHPALDFAMQQDTDVRVVIVENWRRARRLPYQRKKITLIFSAMRHYAKMLRERGYTVDYLKTESLSDALLDHTQTYKPDKIITMAASEYHGRQFQQTHLGRIVHTPVEVLPNTQFLVGHYNPNPEPDPDKQYIMETFYRAMRRHFNVLMHGDEPIGGQWNYDHENRKPLPKDGIILSDIEGFAPDAITRDVMHEIDQRGLGIGQTDGFNYAVTHKQAQIALDTFIRDRLEKFGTYEDAMTESHRMLFHSVLSPYVNLGLLTPMQMIAAAEEAYHAGCAPINSVEGFIRQVLGWREYMYWQYWHQMPELLTANSWNAQRDIPGFMWTGHTDMNCLKHVIKGVIETGYSHHIERLMVLSNFFLLIGAEPQAVVEWYSAMYIDAYDWVMQSNVVGMGLNADGGKIATKPYIASANYINKMSDYCIGCAFKHTKRTGEDACPFNYLYWNFVLENEERLRTNPRTSRSALALRHFDDDERAHIRQHAAQFFDRIYGNHDHA